MLIQGLLLLVLDNRRFGVPYCNSNFEVFNFGVFIHPEMQNKIVRPMVKDLAQLDLPFLSYGQKTVNFSHF